VGGAAHFVAGSEVLKDGLLVRYVLINLTDPGNAALLPGVGDLISAHSARERAAPKEEGGRKLDKAVGKAPRKG